jgi:RNA polymerase sigma-70 factor, ECF subfamily
VQPEVERELIRKCRGGDPRFYEPLVRAYEPQGLRMALGMMGNPEDAWDALQEAFVKAFQSLSRFDPDRAFGPWFFQILRNQCRDMLRSRAARFRVEVVDDDLLSYQSDRGPGSTQRERERTEARRLLWSALERVPEDQREILVLKELEGFRYQEIASVLDIPEGTVASRLFHARKALRDALDEMGAEYP